jgi:hypothetical protein
MKVTYYLDDGKIEAVKQYAEEHGETESEAANYLIGLGLIQLLKGRLEVAGYQKVDLDNDSANGKKGS